MLQRAKCCFCKGLAVLVCMPALLAYACPQENAPDAEDAAGGLWPNGQFVYAFSPEVAADPGKVAAFESACRNLLSSTALRCTPRPQASGSPDYVYVVDGGHDYSYIGRRGGCQPLSILTWSNPIVIAHEIKHALGWAHEQQHPDRDRYMDVNFDAIDPAHRAEFERRSLGNEGPYDPDSMMHFYPADFARPGEVAFRLKPDAAGGGANPGQRDHFTETDLAEIRAVYGTAPVY